MTLDNEAGLVGETPKPAKRGGRPAKNPVAVTQEPAPEVTQEVTVEVPTVVQVIRTPVNGVPAGRIVPEGEEVIVETEEINGYRLSTETVYRERRLPNSPRMTYTLVATAGVPVI